MPVIFSVLSPRRLSQHAVDWRSNLLWWELRDRKKKLQEQSVVQKPSNYLCVDIFPLTVFHLSPRTDRSPSFSPPQVWTVCVPTQGACSFHRSLWVFKEAFGQILSALSNPTVIHIPVQTHSFKWKASSGCACWAPNTKHMYKCINAALFYTNKFVHSDVYVLLLLHAARALGLFPSCIIDEEGANDLFALWIEPPPHPSLSVSLKKCCKSVLYTSGWARARALGRTFVFFYAHQRTVRCGTLRRHGQLSSLMYVALRMWK